MPSASRIRQAFRVSNAGAASRAGDRLRAPAPQRPQPTRSGTDKPSARVKAAENAPGRQGATSDAAEGIRIARVDTSYLESLIGYNARRAALAVIAVFLERLKPYDLRPVDFSTLSLITHNPGITARQLCHTLGILPPNMVGMINAFERRGLVERRPHPTDRRAQGLYLSMQGVDLMQAAERTALELEQDVAHKLSAEEQRTLMGLLQKVYL